MQSRALRRSLILFCLALLFMGAIEIGLRLFPNTLNPRMGNVVYSRYGEFPGGIYYREPHSGIRLMKRDHRDTLYFNGYRWEHQTDSFGFRNPVDVKSKDVLLLGGSLVYGHGVSAQDVVSERLRVMGVDAYNMARQGDGLHSSYVLFRTFLEEFAPKRVVLFAFNNDLADLMEHPAYAALGADNPPPELLEYDYRKVRQGIFSGDTTQHSFGRRIRYHTLAFRFWRAMGKEIEARLAAPAPGANDTGAIPAPPYLQPLLDPRALETGRNYYRHVLADMATRCAQRNIEFSIVHLHAYQPARSRAHMDAAAEFVQLLQATCEPLDIPFHDTTTLFEGRSDCFLKVDGHFNAEGHRVLAEYLKREVFAGVTSKQRENESSR